MNQIVIKKKHGKFRVHLKGRPWLRARGTTEMQAVGTLICDHPEEFSVAPNYDKVGSLQPTKK